MVEGVIQTVVCIIEPVLGVVQHVVGAVELLEGRTAKIPLRLPRAFKGL